MEERTKNRRWLWLVAAVLLLAGLSSLSKLYVDWLWFGSLGYEEVFLTMLATRWGVGLAGFLVTFVFVLANLLLTRRYAGPARPRVTEEGREIIYAEIPSWERFMSSRAAFWLFASISLAVAVVAGTLLAEKWVVVQQFLNSVPFGKSDPIFGQDLSFYMFKLGFYRLVYGLGMTLLVLTTIGVAVVYLLTATFDFFAVDWLEFNLPKAHLGVLLALIFLLKSWAYKLSGFALLYSPSGVVFGAGYTDIHARLLAYKVLMVAGIIVALMILVNIFIKRMSWVIASVGLWLALAILVGGIYPALIQKLSVEPNEFNREKPYIENNISFTRAAYGLDKVEAKHFAVKYDLTLEDLKKNEATVQNIRLWDWQPLKKTYKAIQEIRPYYKFNDIDIDRYVINGKYRQVMLAPRELSQENLPAKAQTWVNRKLKYTHGYGVAMSPVNEVAQEGLPMMFIKDIPPRSTVDIKITRPEIYYGEEPDSYVIVNSGTQEFDYPLGEKNAYCTYQEKSGVKVGNVLRRLVFAWVLGDYKLLLSRDVKAESQVLFYRNIVNRVNRIAPFLLFDEDPYAVVHAGRIYWIIDAYTTSNMYPYSEPADEGVNYIRNSVKVVVDAYNGDTRFYLADDKEPVIQVYSKMFPGLFRPMDEMPEGLKAHIRYPEDLFAIQARMYTVYHMTDPWVFYNKEDKWNIPQEIFGGEAQEVQPYYLIMRLPDEDKPEYILMLPFTPNTKENMIAWLCARSDPPNYGKLRVYDFSKQELLYGPMQVESRINQNSEISQQLTLWDQKGSRIFRGNLLVVPINNSILYVEPLYLQAERSQIPELRRIIAVYGDKVVMEQSLALALTKLFSSEGVTDIGQAEPGVEVDIKDMAKAASEYFRLAKDALKTGNWSLYGDYMKKVEEILNILANKEG